MKVAIVTDWLVSYAGSERVVEAMLGLYPGADIFTNVYDPNAFTGRKIAQCKVQTSFISRLPKACQWYQKYLPLMPIAVEQFDLAEYDVIISSSHAVAKGVITGPDQLHICYCHSPIRYAWDFQHQYLRESNMHKGIKGGLARLILHYMRLWDVRTANGVDQFVANSKYIARRIKKVYGREAEVIYPNVAVDDFVVGEDKDEFYLTASRLVPYKRVDLVVEAFSHMPDKKLVVIGDGPQMDKLRGLATANIEIMGYQSFDVLKEKMIRAKAFVFAAEEDFGIMPVEVQACGTPVIAYGRGGSLETVKDGETGLFFHQQTASAIEEAVTRFEKHPEDWSTATIRAHADIFAETRFKEEFGQLVQNLYVQLQQKRGF